MPPDPQARLRAICLALPGAHEVLTHGEPNFRIRDKQFAVFASAGNHHGNGRPAVWLKAGAGNQDVMVALMPDRFFVPPYVGPRGWLGMWLEKVSQAVAMKRKGMNGFAIASALKIWPRELQDAFMKTAEKLGENGLTKAVDLLVEIDHQSKSGIGNAAENVERFLLSVGDAIGKK